MISDNSVTVGVKCPWSVASVPATHSSTFTRLLRHGLARRGPVHDQNMQILDWAWKDFLRGCIVCHSVSEVATVTQIDAQVVLSKLLDHARLS